MVQPAYLTAFTCLNDNRVVAFALLSADVYFGRRIMLRAATHETARASMLLLMLVSSMILLMVVSLVVVPTSRDYPTPSTKHHAIAGRGPSCCGRNNRLFATLEMALLLSVRATKVVP